MKTPGIQLEAPPKTHTRKNTQLQPKAQTTQGRIKESFQKPTQKHKELANISWAKAKKLLVWSWPGLVLVSSLSSLVLVFVWSWFWSWSGIGFDLGFGLGLVLCWSRLCLWSWSGLGFGLGLVLVRNRKELARGICTQKMVATKHPDQIQEYGHIYTHKVLFI